jgi:hypothetical protein
MKPSDKTELISYLSDTVRIINNILISAQSRNKTVRIKAIISMLGIIKARVESTLGYARYADYGGLPVDLQKSIYDPIIVWLGEELIK